MAELEKFSMLVGGKAVGALSGKTFQSQNPYTGEPWAEIPDGGPEDVDAAVSAARAALDGEWGATTGFARAALMRRLADLITENAERLARLEVNDSGKLFREMHRPAQRAGLLVPLLRRDRGHPRRPPDPHAEPQLPRLHPP